MSALIVILIYLRSILRIRDQLFSLLVILGSRAVDPYYNSEACNDERILFFFSSYYNATRRSICIGA